MSVSYVANIYEVSDFKTGNGFNELRVYGRYNLKNVGKEEYVLAEEVKLLGIKLFNKTIQPREVITITKDDFSRLNGEINQLYFYNIRQTKIYNTGLLNMFKSKTFHVDILKEEGKDLKVLNRGVSNKSLKESKGLAYTKINNIQTEMEYRRERLKLPETGLDRFTPFVIAGICLFGGIGFVIIFKSGLDQIIITLDNIRSVMGMI